MATKQEKLNPQPRLSTVIGIKKEYSVSVTPCCFNLAESEEKKSTFEICNKNFYPLYFRLLTTNSHAMSFQPRSGRLDPLSKVVVTGFHLQSARPIGYQQKLSVMTSRLPFEEWPDQEHFQPMTNGVGKHDHPKPPPKPKSSSESDHQNHFSESNQSRDPELSDYPSAHFARYEHKIIKRTKKHKTSEDFSFDPHTPPKGSGKPPPRPDDPVQTTEQHRRHFEDGPHSHYKSQKERYDDWVAAEVKKGKGYHPPKITIVCHCGNCRGFDQQHRKDGDATLEEDGWNQPSNRQPKKHHKNVPKAKCQKYDHTYHGSSSESTDVSHDAVLATRVKGVSTSSSSDWSIDSSTLRESFPRVLSKCNRMLEECNRILQLTRANFILILLLFIVFVVCLVFAGIKSLQSSPYCYEHPWLLYNFCSK